MDSRGTRDSDQNRRRVHHDTTPRRRVGNGDRKGPPRENRVVYTYIKPDRFLAHVDALREFLHRFGRETNQEVVVAELSGAEGSWFFRIREYDE